MKKIFVILFSFVISLALYGQDGRIDTLAVMDGKDAYHLRNNIDSLGIWSVDIIRRTEILSQRDLEIPDTIVRVNHKRYNNFYLEIRGDQSYQFLIDEENKEKYYIYSDVYADPKNGLESYIQCLYSSVSYPRKAQKNNIEGMALMRLYIGEDGCLDKVEAQSSLGYGIEEATKKAMMLCDCEFNPSKRNDEPVNAIWMMPMRFKMN